MKYVEKNCKNVWPSKNTYINFTIIVQALYFWIVFDQCSAQRCVLPVSILVDLLLYHSKSTGKETGKTHLCAFVKVVLYLVLSAALNKFSWMWVHKLIEPMWISIHTLLLTAIAHAIITLQFLLNLYVCSSFIWNLKISP